MIIISHRGNINGANAEAENTHEQIQMALKKGFNVEADVWAIDNKIFLGHDEPKEEISVTFLKKDGIWCHAKNIEALFLLSILDAHVFWHQNDDYTLTSRGCIWTYPGKVLTHRSIAVLPENSTGWDLENACGVCTDYPERYYKT